MIVDLAAQVCKKPYASWLAACLGCRGWGTWICVYELSIRWHLERHKGKIITEAHEVAQQVQAQQVKALATKSDNLCSIPETHVVERETSKLTFDLHLLTRDIWLPAYNLKEKRKWSAKSKAYIGVVTQVSQCLVSVKISVDIKGGFYPERWWGKMLLTRAWMM